MAFDFKKEYREYYMPKTKPQIISVPTATYIAARGKGNPNEEGGAYKKAIGILYSIAYTLKMSYKGARKIEGFYDYVVPPLEGFWYQENSIAIDYSNKIDFCWISEIRLPDFIKKDDFDWAVAEAAKKKKIDCTAAELMTIDEGMCVQMMHIGGYDDEPASVKTMDEYAFASGYQIDLNETRLHHEIYLSDPRKTEISKLKTVIRHPIRKKND